MPLETQRSAYWRGVRDGAPFLLVVTPFAMLFGVVATEAGLNLVETMAFSIVVIAGAAQFAAVQLMVDNAPTVVVLASSLAINLRMAMYSASLTPHLGPAPLWQRVLVAYFMVDQTYACSIARYETEPDWGIVQKIAYFFGTMTPICPMWYAMTLAGALIGSAMPAGLALDFAVPITFIALIAPMLRTAAHKVAALVAVALALVLAGLPYNLGLILSGLGGMVAGARVELWLERRGLWA